MSATADKVPAEQAGEEQGKPETLVEALTGLKDIAARTVHDTLEDAGITGAARDAAPSDEQAKRLADVRAGKKAGLRGKALVLWIVTGDTGAKPAREAREKARRAQSAAKRANGRGPRPGSTVSAIHTVLGKARGPLTPKEVYDRIVKGKLAPGLKGKTPVQTVAARLAVGSKPGGPFERPERGKYTLRKKASA